MTLTDRKGNIRGREFPTDTGIDGNACEETAKDQRWVGLYRQIPDTDTRPISVSLCLSLSFSPSRYPPLSRLLFCSLSLCVSLSLSSAPALASPLIQHPSIRPYDPLDRTHASQHSLPRTAARPGFHDGDPLGRRSPWKRPRRRRTPRHDLSHSRPVVL